jgi:hypothetical protein
MTFCIFFFNSDDWLNTVYPASHLAFFGSWKEWGLENECFRHWVCLRNPLPRQINDLKGDEVGRGTHISETPATWIISVLCISGTLSQVLWWNLLYLSLKCGVENSADVFFLQSSWLVFKGGHRKALPKDCQVLTKCNLEDLILVVGQLPVFSPAQLVLSALFPAAHLERWCVLTLLWNIECFKNIGLRKSQNKIWIVITSFYPKA